MDRALPEETGAGGGLSVTDPTLHGNHDPCPACEMRREVLPGAGRWKGVR